MTEREASGRPVDDLAAGGGGVEPAAVDSDAAEGGEPAAAPPGATPEPAPDVDPEPEREPEPEPEPEPERESEPEPEPEPEPAPDLDPDPEPEPDLEPDGSRHAGLRLAGIHLRTGLHTLARAELEAFAGRGQLDGAALLDLAEVRWRTGDLAGAGDAAKAVLAGGSEAPLALVVAAEAVAALGRPGEARRLAARLGELKSGELATIFAGMPMALIWPDESTAAAADPDASGRAALAGTARPAVRRRGKSGADTSDEPVAAPAAAAEAFAGGRGALAAGDQARAALLLGVALRLEPGFASAVLGAVTGRDEDPLLALVEGDALRLLGREAEALAAFDRARGQRKDANGRTRGHGRQLSPGLFDDAPDTPDAAAD
jgi:hypothetical protein